MSLYNSSEQALLQLLFHNADWTGIGDAGGLLGSTAAGNWYAGLLKVAATDSTPGTECTYANYTRVAIGRTALDWTLGTGNVSNTAIVLFPEMGFGANETAVGWALYSANAGGSPVFYGTITSPPGGLVISTGITPKVSVGQMIINLD